MDTTVPTYLSGLPRILNGDAPSIIVTNDIHGRVRLLVDTPEHGPLAFAAVSFTDEQALRLAHSILNRLVRQTA